VNSFLMFGLVTVVVLTILGAIFAAMKQGPSTLLAIAAVLTAATSLVGALVLLPFPS
jgi:hypothetical protein